MAPYADQDDFELSMLDEVENYRGFKKTGNAVLNPALFDLF